MPNKLCEPYSDNHPETQEGEIFITNTYKFAPREICEVTWATKRKGKIAYDIYGNPITNLVPIFAQRSELEKAGVDIEVARRKIVEKTKLKI